MCFVGMSRLSPSTWCIFDPPFNSNQEYHLLFAARDGARGTRPVRTFADTWRWDEAAARAYEETVAAGGCVAQALQAFRGLLGEGDLLAYLAMMAPRLVELHRVLKASGSTYLHCSPAASHYLKVLMDAIYGPARFRREVVWRSGWVSGFKARARNWVRNHDVLLYYVKDNAADFTFDKERAYRPHADGYRRRGGGGNAQGIALDDVWDEVTLYSPWIKSFSCEKLGYMTQKPLALLERIVAVSSREGDLVLDPFAGSGTTLHAAQKLGRRWIGIDSAPVAVRLSQRRLREAFGDQAAFQVVGAPACPA